MKFNHLEMRQDQLEVKFEREFNFAKQRLDHNLEASLKTREEREVGGAVLYLVSYFHPENKSFSELLASILGQQLFTQFEQVWRQSHHFDPDYATKLRNRGFFHLQCGLAAGGDQEINQRLLASRKLFSTPWLAFINLII